MKTDFILTRQAFCRTSLAVLMLASWTTGPANAKADDGKIDIAINTKAGVQQKVDARFEHDGKVIVDQAGQKSEAQRLRMKTVAKLAYHQRLTGSPKDPQAVRYYGSSHGNFSIEKGKTEAELAKANRLVVARLRSQPGRRLQMASVLDMLNQTEFNLIKNPADPLTYARLLEKKDVAAGDRWDVAKEPLADFLSVDRILSSDARLMLKTVSDDSARIYLLGNVDATIDDVGTHLKVSGIFDIDTDNRQVTNVRLNIDEVREPGQVAPGFEGKSRVNLRLKSDDSCPQLTTASLRKHTQSRAIKQRLRWGKEDSFALQYDPRWRMIASESEAAILRYVDDGDLMAQCNIVQLPSRPADNPLKLDDYKAEIGKIIRLDPSAKITDSKRLKTSTGLEALRISVTGVENELPVEWIYYHVASRDGRRLTFVFTMEREVADLFEPADQRIVNGLNFFDKTSQAFASTADSRSSEGTPNKASKANRR